jgi:ubiquinone/menaquinone biosynthesis C-methylase UbiE
MMRASHHSRPGRVPHVDSGATRGHVIHWAPVYDLAFGRFLRRTHGAVVELAALGPGEKVLDVGCGTGSLAVALKVPAGSTGSVHGIDASQEMIEEARRNASKAGADVNFQVGLAEAIPFPNGTFDLVVSQLAIHHLPDDLKQPAFGEMHRVLKSGGRCLIVENAGFTKVEAGRTRHRLLSFVRGEVAR